MPSPLTQEQLDYFKQRLLQEEADLIREQDQLMENVRAYTQGSAEHGDFGEDEAGSGSDTEEREKNRYIAETMGTQLLQVRHALERMEQGLYGVCEVTNEPIDIERLEAFPSATTSIKGARLRGRS